VKRGLEMYMNIEKIKVIIVRHGETQWNLEGRWQGHDDSPLTVAGIQQAEAVANYLVNHNFSVIYSSDLGRAFQTAKRISDKTGKKIITDYRLRERHLGVFQGLTESEIRETLPDEYGRYHGMYPDHVIPNGESVRQLHERSISCINEITQKHLGESIVLVTHGGVLNGFLRYVIGISLEAPRMFKLWNAGINIFSHENSNWMLYTFGDVHHLDSMGSLDDG
jgi:2,3-bisphosphoglycerate-dependent phosphoglycerate mutase